MQTMKKFMKSGLLGLMLLLPGLVQAVPMLVTISGEVNYSHDLSNVFGLGIGGDTIIGASISATYTFDTDNTGTDTQSGDPENVFFMPGTDWVSSTLTIDTASVESSFNVEDLVTAEDQIFDTLFLQDEDNGGDGLDRYFVRNYERNSVTGEYAFSYAQIYSNLDNLMTSFDPAQTLTWSASDYVNDLGNGYFEYSTDFGSDYSYGQYTITEFTVSSVAVPEPSIIFLSVLSLFGLGLAQVRNKKQVLLVS